MTGFFYHIAEYRADDEAVGCVVRDVLLHYIIKPLGLYTLYHRTPSGESHDCRIAKSPFHPKTVVCTCPLQYLHSFTPVRQDAGRTTTAAPSGGARRWSFVVRNNLSWMLVISALRCMMGISTRSSFSYASDVSPLGIVASQTRRE